MRTSKTQATLPDVTQTLAAEIRAFSGRLRRQLREHGVNHDFAPSQVSALLRLEGLGSATVSTLARAEGLRPQSMSAAVTVLLEAGLVQGTPDPKDGRQTLMSLTPKCVEWLREGRSSKQDWLAAAIAQKLTAREQDQLQRSMGLLARLVED